MTNRAARLRATSLLFFFTSSLHANGLILSPGPRADALGRAYVAIADDVSAIYWNPAGLSALEGHGVELSLLSMDTKNKSSHSLMNSETPDQANGDFPFANIYGPTVSASLGLPMAVEPSEYRSKEAKVCARIPFFGGYGKAAGLTFAAGFYGVGGAAGKWGDSVTTALFGDNITAKLNASTGFTVANVSLAKNVAPKFSLGAGLDYVTMIDKMKIEKTYTPSAASPLTAYDLMLKKTASGSGIQWNLGILVKPSEKLHLGFVYRSGATLTLKGKADYRQTGLAFLGPAYADIPATHANYTRKYAYPASWDLGFSYEPKKSLTLAASVSVFHYSSLKDETVYDDKSVFSDTHETMGWKDVGGINMGAEYRANAKLALRAGFSTDPTTMKRGKLTLINVNQYYYNSLCLGMGYKVGTVQLDGGLKYNLSNQPRNGPRSYEMPTLILKVGAGTRF